MTRYERAWWISSRCVAAAGLAAAWFTWGTAIAAWMFSLGFVMGATTAILLYMLDYSMSPRRIVSAGFTGGLLVLSVGGLTVVLQLWALAVATVFLIGSPWVLDRLRGRTPNANASRTLRVQAALSTSVLPHRPLPPRTPVGSLSDQALRSAWQSSHHELMQAESLAARAEIVQLRQEYLDELERRDPGAIAAWFASGA